MAFSGFGPQAVPFFKALAFHQTKDWFEANRAIYEGDIKAPLGDLVEELAARFAKAKMPLKGDRKTSLFRIYRDVRFAKDKSPYKTNAGAVLTRGGEKNEPGLFYVHIAPTAASPPPASRSPSRRALARLRAAIVRAPKAWKRDGRQARQRRTRARRRKRDETRPARLRGRSRMPKSPRRCATDVVHLLARHRQRAARQGRRWSTISSAFAKDAMPLLEWGWSAVVDAR